MSGVAAARRPFRSPWQNRSASAPEGRTEAAPASTECLVDPSSWMDLPPGPDRLQRWRLWVCEELYARGRVESAVMFAKGQSVAWQPPAARAAAPPTPAAREEERSLWETDE